MVESNTISAKSIRKGKQRRTTIYSFPPTMTTEKTPLEQLKQIEKKQKEMLLNKSLKRLKELCLLALETKQRVNAITEILGLTEKDSKGIIDWVNSLSDVQLTEEDKKEIMLEEVNLMNQKRIEVEKQSEKYWHNSFTDGTGYMSLNCAGTVTAVGYSDTMNKVVTTPYITSTGLEIKAQ